MLYNHDNVNIYKILSTGSAAINVEENTLHSLLKIPVKSNMFAPLTNKAAIIFQLEYKNLKF